METNTRAVRERLRIPVQGTNRKYYLHWRAGAWCVRMEMPTRLRTQYADLRKTFTHSTRTNDLKVAKIRAATKIHALVTPLLVRGDGMVENPAHAELIAQLRPKKPTQAKATIGAVCERFKPRRDDAKRNTARDYLSSLRMYAREVSGLQEVDDVAIAEVINAAMWEKFRDLREERVADCEDELRHEQVKRTLKTNANSIKAVFSPKVMSRCYADLEMPSAAIAEFRQAARVGKVNEYQLGFEPWPPGFAHELEQDAERELRPFRRNLYLAFLLMSRLGLRNSEVEHAKWEWLELHEGKTYFRVPAVCSYFKSKNRQSRSLRLSDDLLERLLPFRQSPDAWMINERTKTERHDATHDVINAWLRPKMAARSMVRGPRGKCAYQLRGWAGSRVWTITGSIAAAAAFLGDTEQTTRKNYARWLKAVDALTTIQFTDRFDAVAA